MPRSGKVKRCEGVEETKRKVCRKFINGESSGYAAENYSHFKCVGDGGLCLPVPVASCSHASHKLFLLVGPLKAVVLNSSRIPATETRRRLCFCLLFPTTGEASLQDDKPGRRRLTTVREDFMRDAAEVLWSEGIMSHIPSSRSRTMREISKAKAVHEQLWVNSRNRSGKHDRTRTVLLIISALSLAACAWFSLVFSSRSACKQRSPSIFPWEPLEHEQKRSLLGIKRAYHPTEDLDVSQILFGIAAASKLWPRRKEYVKLWWRPGEMRGFVWLEEKVKHHSDQHLPAIKVSESISNFSYTNPSGHPSGIRIARIVQEAFRLNLPNVRWFVMCDDDTVFAVDNLVKVLRKYNSSELYYIGNPSESHSSNTYFSHGMAFGGGGIAISYPLAKALSSMLDDCIERYPFLFGSDDRLHACISELGVPLTKELGFHQFDVHGNAFGFLAGHAIAPFVSMHHLEEVDPLFPRYGAMKGLQHFVEAMNTEPSSFLQRCICYDREKELTFSISSGYVIQVYPYVLLPRELERPEITFKAWNKRNGGGEFDLDTRAAIKSVCDKPALFFLDKIYHYGSDVVSIYKLDASSITKKWWSFCFPRKSDSDDIKQIQVASKPLDEHWFKVPRRQCCKLKALQEHKLHIVVDSCQVERRQPV